MKEQLDISVVVLNYNTSDLLLGALESIVSSTSGLSYEVVVIDNASTDGGMANARTALGEDSRFTFIQRETNIGWAAINIMLERKGKYIATVDPDAIVHNGALETLFSFLESHPRAGAVTAKLLNPDGTPQLYYRRIMTPSFYFFTTVLGRGIDKYFLGLTRWKQYRYEGETLLETTEIEQPAWPTLMWRREALGAYIVDKEIPFYFVDVDMSRRVYDNGYKIYLVPEATITHLKSASFGRTKNAWREREYGRSLKFYFKKHYPAFVPVLFMLAALDICMRAAVRAVAGREPLR